MFWEKASHSCRLLRTRPTTRSGRWCAPPTPSWPATPPCTTTGRRTGTSSIRPLHKSRRFWHRYKQNCYQIVCQNKPLKLSLTKENRFWYQFRWRISCSTGIQNQLCLETSTVFCHLCEKKWYSSRVACEVSKVFVSKWATKVDSESVAFGTSKVLCCALMKELLMSYDTMAIGVCVKISY